MYDQLGRNLKLQAIPKRVVCLVPSLTELLVDLGLKNQLVGLTKFCVHPENLRKEKVVVGGTKSVHIKRLADLKPDFILCNKEENTPQIVADCAEIAPVYVSDIVAFEELYTLLKDLGEVFQIQTKTQMLTQTLQKQIATFRLRSAPFQKRLVAYVIWNEPLMVAGDRTFIQTLLELCNFQNAFAHENQRYPVIQKSDLKDLDLILLSSEPFPFKEKHIEAFKRHTRANILCVDGEYFNWYGSRLLKAFDYFEKLLTQID